MTDVFLKNPVGDRSRMTEIDSRLALASAHFRAGRYDLADALCGEIAGAAPRHAEAHNLWAAVALQLGRPLQAAERWATAIDCDAGVREYHHNRGNVLRSLGRTAEAIVCYRAALDLAPDAADSCFELAIALAESGQDEEALRLFKALVAAAPEVAEAYHRIGILRLVVRHNGQAIIDIRRAVAIQPDFTDAHTNLAVMLREEASIELAVEEFRRTLLLRPDDAFLLSNLGTVLNELGKGEDAMRLFERAVTLLPDEAEFHYSLAMGSSVKRGDPRLAGLERLAVRLPSLDGKAQINLHFALAKAYEDVGEPDRSFTHLLRGNALKRAEMVYDEQAALAGLERIERVFTPALAQGGGGDPSDLPIFVLGMPRSGSSLIEQILASHPMVFGAGELPDLPLLVRQLGPDSGPFFPEIAASMSDRDFAEIGERYLARLRGKAPRAVRIVDKLPENYRLIGLIRRALPNARIIHTRRDPVDTCLSIFSKLFSVDTPFYYDLGEIGRYWRGYDRLMAHWRAVLPEGAILDVDYEAMVADQEGQTRRLLDYCGLPWDDACLSFHRTDRLVRTASSLQVRKPLYSSSVGRWRPAPDFLAPLLAGFAGDGKA